MRNSSITLGVLALLAAALASCGSTQVHSTPPRQAHGQAVQTPGQGPKPRIGAIDPAVLAQLIHQKVNAVRRANGLAELGWNGALVAIATGHSRDMQQRGYFAHVSPSGEDFASRYRRGGYECRVPAGPGRFLLGGENLAQVQQVAQWLVWEDGRKEPEQIRSAEELAEVTVTGWWNSPPHKQNLLRPEWLSQAIGVVVTADGGVWVTQNFC